MVNHRSYDCSVIVTCFVISPQPLGLKSLQVVSARQSDSTVTVTGDQADSDQSNRLLLKMRLAIEIRTRAHLPLNECMKRLENDTRTLSLSL